MSKLSSAMQNAIAHFEQHKNFGNARISTINALVKRGLVANDADQFTLKEQIGVNKPNRLALKFFNRAHSLTPDIDPQPGDYEFWDAARNGRAEGLELSGLFLKPLQSKKAAWTLGVPPIFKYDDEYTQEKVNEWYARHHSKILEAYEEAIGLGDFFVVVNGDFSLTLVPPHVVEPIADPEDYSKRLGWRISVVYAEPTKFADTMTIEDIYTAEYRERVFTKNGIVLKRERYRNPLGVVPVVHIVNNRASNETYGRPEGYALIHAMQRYGEVFDSAITGNIKQGRPTPVFQKMGSADAVESFYQQFGQQRVRELPDGTTETITEMNFSSDDAVILGETGEFKYEAPGSFTSDTSNLLGLLFYLVLQHTEIPEFVWGNAIASSKASADSQMTPFIKWIEKNQGRAEGWLLQLIGIINLMLAYTDRRVKVQTAVIKWVSLSAKDNALILQAIQFFYSNDMLDRNTALMLSPLDVDDIQAILDRVDTERAERQQQFDQQVDATINKLADGADDEAQPEPEGELA